VSLAVIIGAGPGIGAAVARRFALEGMDIGIVARTDALASTLPGARLARADVADEHALIAALDELGTPDVLVYNAGLIRPDRPGELSHAEHQRAYAINVLGAITAAAHVAPRMAAGTIVLTGGMPEPLAAYTSLSLGKAGIRAATRILAEAFPHVHVATVLVAGAVEPGGPFDPDAIAEEYLRLHTQPPAAWERDVLYAGRGVTSQAPTTGT
jgi:NAD(P)-dependent dehydrogenase (short-subunit alcohol dehydrogenase family)